MSEYEAYQTARVEGFIPADQSFEEYLLAEVKRLHKLLLTHDVCPTCGYYADNDFSLDCCKTWGLVE